MFSKALKYEKHLTNFTQEIIFRTKKLEIWVPNAGGFAIIASAEKTGPNGPSGLVQAGSNEFIMALSCFFWVEISDRPDGRNPLFFTISTKPNISKSNTEKDHTFLTNKYIR